MTSDEARAKFAEIVSRQEEALELDQAALLIAAEEYPQLEVDACLGQLDAFAYVARDREHSQGELLPRLLGLNHLLFDELGFRGNATNYYDARNSFLNEVIQRRSGIPITLSIIYLEVARRIDLPLNGVGMPGHFIVKCADTEQEIFIDPFHQGRILTRERCREMIAEIYDGRMEFQPTFLRATPKRQILTRMLQNLKGIYARATAHHKTLAAIERLLLLDPDSATEIRDRGIVYFAIGRYAQARMDLEEYLRRAPAAEDAGEIKKRISQLRQKQARLN